MTNTSLLRKKQLHFLEEKTTKVESVYHDLMTDNFTFAENPLTKLITTLIIKQKRCWVVTTGKSIVMIMAYDNQQVGWSSYFKKEVLEVLSYRDDIHNKANIFHINLFFMFLFYKIIIVLIKSMPSLRYGVRDASPNSSFYVTVKKKKVISEWRYLTLCAT